jgi:ribosomal protein L37AE/L43A
VPSRVDQILIGLWDCFACGFCFLGHLWASEVKRSMSYFQTGRKIVICPLRAAAQAWIEK